MNPTLKIFITENCPGCNDARKIAAQIEQNYPKIVVELVDITEPRAAVPEAIFATPTYMLNDRVVSLGNPSPEQIAQWVEEAAIQPEP